MHVVMNIVLLFAMWIQCVVQVHIVCVPLENQSDVCSGSIYGPILWVMCKGLIQCRICCMYKGPILWGHDAEPDACIEDQSYGTVHVATCTYAQSQVMVLCQVQRTCYIGTQHAKSVVVKRNTSLYRGYVQHYTRSRYSNQWPVQNAQQ